MKKVIIKNLDGVQTHGGLFDDASEWIAEGVRENWWGLPERWVDASESHDVKDVLDEQEEIDSTTGDIISKVKLRAQYSIEIIDVTQEHALRQCLEMRRMKYPTAEEFLNAFFDGGDQALEELKQKRLAVKKQFPKP